MTQSLFPPSSQPPDYAFTEFVTVSFSRPVDLNDKATPEGQVWDRTIQLYHSTAGVKALWWGFVVGSQEVVKLIIEWTSAPKRETFLTSSELASLVASWHSSIQTGFTSTPSTIYKLDPRLPTRQNVFRPPRQFSEDNITILLTFHFSASFDSEAILQSEDDQGQPARTMRQDWELSWDLFAHSALKSEGGIVSSRGDGGWSVQQGEGQQVSWIGAFRFMNVEKAREFLKQEESAGDASSGWGRLRGIVGDYGGSVEVEFLNMVYAV